jgi:hypothetical protein
MSRLLASWQDIQTICRGLRVEVWQLETWFYALELIFLGWNICMSWDIEYTDEIGGWWGFSG